MGQDPLFDPPPARLPRRLHDEVFGALPALLCRALDVAEVAEVVRPLLTRGWRPAQLGARVGALPASDDPVPAVIAFLRTLADRDSPAAAWQQAREAQAVSRTPGAAEHRVASDEARDHWIAEARRNLGLPRRTRPVARAPVAPRCASCTGEAAFFVTRDVRLCPECVQLLGSGRARLAVGA